MIAYVYKQWTERFLSSPTSECSFLTINGFQEFQPVVQMMDTKHKNNNV